MNPNNNFSVLPWYDSLSQQNARKWWVYDRIYPLFTPAKRLLPFQIIITEDIGEDDDIQFTIYKSDGTLVGDFTTQLLNSNRFQIIDTYDGMHIVVYRGDGYDLFTSFENGQYYGKLVFGDNAVIKYSEIFTVVNDIAPYLKIQWYDRADFVMDGGVIVYKLGGLTYFKNELYLQADIAKPEYTFEDEGENRDGYFFPTKQISEKKYRFSFLASEYLLDVMRFIRMADYITITKNNQIYNVDNFLITPTWEDNGDVAGVDAEFDTDTVAKKLGVGYIR